MNIKFCGINDFLDIIDNKKIICFGLGVRARMICENYNKILNHIEFFVDNDKKKQGAHVILGKTFEVVSSECLLGLEHYENRVMLITTKFFNEIIEQFEGSDKLKDLDAYIYPLMEEYEETYEADNCKIEHITDTPIPKIIHYCWLGQNKKSELHEKCISSWKKYCPDYKIIEWNESNFDININKYVKEAYASKKYAFVSDFVRLYAIYNYGGIYMDTDVEIIKPIDDLLFVPGFMSFETKKYIQSGIMAGEKGNLWFKEQLDSYREDSFFDENGNPILVTNVERITRISKEQHGFIPNGSKQQLKYGIIIYPRAFFCPKSVVTNKINISKNTYAIHHFALTWFGKGVEERNIKLYEYIKNMGK